MTADRNLSTGCHMMDISILYYPLLPPRAAIGNALPVLQNRKF
ncbi:MAG: hypothetical protein SOW15_03175 [Ruminococcus callidus]|nr:hypothetical protein [Ruminococcus callidus]